MEAKKKTKHPGGRPTLYTKEIGQSICTLLSTTTMTMKQICDSSPDFPRSQSTVYLWIIQQPEFSEMYATARKAQADVRADSVHDIALECDEFNPSSVNKARLMIDTIKWHTSKVLPKTYGNYTDDRKEHEESLVERLSKKFKDK